MEVLIMKIESIPLLNERCRGNKQNIKELTDIFKKGFHIFMNVNLKRNISRSGQLRWQSDIKEA